MHLNKRMLLASIAATVVAMAGPALAQNKYDTGANDKGNPVLTAIGLDKKQAREVVRVSFSAMTTRAEAEAAARIIADEARVLRDAAPRDTVPGDRASGAGGATRGAWKEPPGRITRGLAPQRACGRDAGSLRPHTRP